MRHGGAHKDCLGASSVELRDQGVDKTADELRVGAFVHVLTSVIVVNVDRVGPEPAGQLGEVVAEHHVVQAAE